MRVRVTLAGEDFVLPCAPGSEDVLRAWAVAFAARLDMLSDEPGAPAWVRAGLALTAELEAAQQEAKAAFDALNAASHRLEAITARLG